MLINKKGFTLIELLIVIAIIGILSGILLVAINPQSIIQKSRDAKRLKDVEALYSAISLALSDSEINLLDTSTACGDTGCTQEDGGYVVDGSGYVRYTLTGATGLAKFIPTLPRDPLSDATHTYIYSSDGVNFEINATLEHADNPVSVFSSGDENRLMSALRSISEDQVAAIIYTSGTTGFSKGVMLTHKNLVSNIVSTYVIQPIVPGDRMLSILPLSHTYECTLGFLMPLFYGATVYYLSGVPSPTILLDALGKIKPTLMLSVPLVIEKIFKNRIAPKFSSGLPKTLYAFPPTRKLLHRIAGKKLMESFGGQIHFFGIGGALLDESVERFLWEAGFPYFIGYGLTETSPLVAGTPSRPSKFRSTGYCLPGQEMKLINVDSSTGEGEIVTRGDNVMKGYYKNEELTQSVFTNDGWFRTGDLGFMDKTQRLFFKGRLKNVIIGANGKNIYPEEIEAVVNRHRFVLESIVYEMKGKLIAMVHLDYQKVEEFYNQLRTNARNFQDNMEIQINQILADIQHFVNMQLNVHSHIAVVIEQPVPFEKTPTMKIKKYKYIA